MYPLFYRELKAAYNVDVLPTLIILENSSEFHLSCLSSSSVPFVHYDISFNAISGNLEISFSCSWGTYELCIILSHVIFFFFSYLHMADFMHTCTCFYMAINDLKLNWFELSWMHSCVLQHSHDPGTPILLQFNRLWTNLTYLSNHCSFFPPIVLMFGSCFQHLYNPNPLWCYIWLV